jgi:hypothetical protein
MLYTASGAASSRDSDKLIPLQTGSMDVFRLLVQDRFTFPDASKSILEAIL